MYIYENISLNSAYIEKYFRQIWTENQNTYFLFNIFLSENRVFHGTTRQVTGQDIIRRLYAV
jgi:hypothetical protein